MYEGSLWIIALYQVGLMSFDKQIRKGNLFMIVFLFLSNNRWDIKINWSFWGYDEIISSIGNQVVL